MQRALALHQETASSPVARSTARLACPAYLQRTHPRATTNMHFDFSPKVIALREQLLRFMDEHVYPNEQRREESLAANAKAGGPYAELPRIAGRKAKALAQGLWNLYLP